MKPVKIIVDVLLLSCFVGLAFFHVTGARVHSILGLLMIALVWLHVVLNWKQISVVIKKCVTSNAKVIKVIAGVCIVIFGLLTVLSVVHIAPKLVGSHSGEQGGKVQDGKTGEQNDNVHTPKSGESK